MNNIINLSLLKLKAKNIPTPELDLKILLKEASFNKKDIIFSNFKIEEINIDYFNLLFSKRLNNQPISKIINKKNFWKNEFFVNFDVLDPRPESELIIEEVLNLTKDINKKLKILDIGTGSGCLAISLAKELKNSSITAIDISNKAIKVAKKNILLHNVGNQVDVKLGGLENVKTKFDIIISNPPYINSTEYDKLQIEVKKFEPKVALLGGNDGLKFYRYFAKNIEKIMKRKSFFICEIGHNQLKPCRNIFSNTNLTLVKVTQDLQKIDRTLTFFKI